MSTPPAAINKEDEVIYHVDEKWKRELNDGLDRGSPAHVNLLYSFSPINPLFSLLEGVTERAPVYFVDN